MSGEKKIPKVVGGPGDVRSVRIWSWPMTGGALPGPEIQCWGRAGRRSRTWLVLRDPDAGLARRGIRRGKLLPERGLQAVHGHRHRGAVPVEDERLVAPGQDAEGAIIGPLKRCPPGIVPDIN